MKIVIDLPDKAYGVIKYFESALDSNYEKRDKISTVLIKSVLNGTPLTPRQYEIIRRAEAFYAKATALGYIQNPLAWALYQVWQEVDKAESEDEDESI